MDLDALSALQRETFGGTAESARFFRELAGDENHRIVELDGKMAGGLLLVPMGQYFGGRRVSMTGIAGSRWHPSTAVAVRRHA